MGAGEKRVFEVLKAAHDPSIMPNGLLLIDELDVLLHEKAFKKLVTELIDIADESLLEIVFRLTGNLSFSSSERSILLVFLIWVQGLGHFPVYLLMRYVS